MQQTYDEIKKHIITIINKYRYKHFNGPLTAANFSTLVELSTLKDTDEIYDLLNKTDMETRINFLETMKYLSSPYTISNNKIDYYYCIFIWEDYKIFNLYRTLKEKDKHTVWRLLLKENVYFECLSPDLLLIGIQI